MKNKSTLNFEIKYTFFTQFTALTFYRWLIICLCTLVTFTVVSQTNADSLKLEEILHKTSSFYSGDSIAVLSYCDELEVLAFNTSDSLIKSEAYRIAGNLYGRMGYYSKAFEFLGKSIAATRNLPKNISEISKAKSLTNKGEFFQQNGDFGEALNCYLEAEKLFYISNNFEGLIGVYSNMANLYDKILQPEKREQINEKAFSLAEATTDTIAKIKAYTGKATNLSNENKYQEAITYYQKTLELSQDINNKNLEHVAYYDLGFTYSRMKDYSKAIEMYGKSLEAARLTGSLNDIGDALYKLGLVYYYSENYTKSEEKLVEAMKVADKINSDILRRNIYDVLYSLEESKGNFKKAYEYLNKYVDVEFEIFSEQDQQQVNFLKAKFDAEKREFLISKLEAEKEIQSLKLIKKNWLILALAMFLLFTLTFALFVIRQNRYKQKLAEKQKLIQEQKISEMEKEKQLLAAKSVLQGEEKERSRLASDLHDGLGGLLSGVKINLSNMKENVYLSEKQVAAFGQVISLLDSSIVELRRIAHNMVPETLHNYGLKTAIHDFCIEISQAGAPEVNFSFYGSDKRLSTELELSLFRISQELINNAIKHADASLINVQLFEEEMRVALQVFDNGHGFNPKETEKNNKGQGIKNIKNRVAAFGGKIEIYSQPDQGTEILIEFET